MKNLNFNEKEFRDYLDYLYKLPFIMRKRLYLPEEITYGCEVELDGISLGRSMVLVRDFNNHYWRDNNYYCYDDDTVDAEIVTPKCTDSVAMWDRFEKLLNLIKEYGAKTGPTVSGHVHIGTHNIDTFEKLKNLIKVLCVYEPLIFKFGYGFGNEAKYFHKCWDYNKKDTYTRMMNPLEVDNFIKILENNNKSAADMFAAFLEFIHCETFFRPVFNFRRYDFIKLGTWDDYQFALYEIYLKGIENNTHYSKWKKVREDHIEFRSFNGDLDVRIWQNNVSFVGRIIYAVSNDLVDMEEIDKLFEKYRKKRYLFYNRKNPMDMPEAKRYNEYLDLYSLNDEEMAISFAETFYNIFPEDELAKDYFYKQYFKLFNEEDKMTLKLAK